MKRTLHGELDAELIGRLAQFGRPASVRELFLGSHPRWAIEAAIRCETRGLTRELPDGRLELLPAGREIGAASW